LHVLLVLLWNSYIHAIGVWEWVHFPIPPPTARKCKNSKLFEKQAMYVSQCLLFLWLRQLLTNYMLCVWLNSKIIKISQLSAKFIIQKICAQKSCELVHSCRVVYNCSSALFASVPALLHLSGCGQWPGYRMANSMLCCVGCYC
jgi:hypothetical protein